MSQDRWDQAVVAVFVLTAALGLAAPVAWLLGSAASAIVAVFASSLSNVALTVVIELSRPERRPVRRTPPEETA